MFMYFIYQYCILRVASNLSELCEKKKKKTKNNLKNGIRIGISSNIHI